MSEDWGALVELQLQEIKFRNAVYVSDKKVRFAEHEISSVHVFSSSCGNDRINEESTVLKKNSTLSKLIAETSEVYEDDEPDLSAAECSLLKKILRTRLLDTTAEVEIQRRKDNSPLHSVKSFEQLQLPPDLLKGVYALGFNAPSKIQETSLPTIMADPPVNLIAQAQSGTGKTAAFLLGSLSRINPNEEYPQVLILSPTYELALQIGQVAKKMAQFCPDIKFRYAVKGEFIQRGDTIKEHMIIGTPGKVFDWARRFHYFDIKKIKVFVLDEADVMISTQGHQDQCIRIHKMLVLGPDGFNNEIVQPHHLTSSCQMLLFSATYTREVMDFAEQIVEDPVIIRLRREEETLDNVHQYYISCPSPNDKYKSLQDIYGSLSVGQTIIFCRLKATACWLGNKLAEDGHSVGYLSSDLNVEERRAVITSFREGKEKVLITTNVCARGIDIEQVTMVINYDIPILLNGEADCDTYLHRIGRTGRFGKTGFAINFVSSQKDMQLIRDIEQHFGKKIKEMSEENMADLE